MLYRSWCSSLNIDPKEEKAQKPFVCQKHFNPKHIVGGVLKSHVTPLKKSVATKRYKKKKKRKESSRGLGKAANADAEILNKCMGVCKELLTDVKHFLETQNEPCQEEIEYEFAEAEIDDIEIKEEPFEEVTIGEARFADQHQQLQLPRAPIKVEYLQAHIEPSPVTTQISSQQVNVRKNLRQDSDEEFLESLLPDILRMTSRQKEIFHNAMKLKYQRDKRHQK